MNSKWTSLALLILIGSFVFLLLGQNIRRAELKSAVLGLQVKIDEARKNKDYLEKFSAYFQSPQFLEKEARAKLNYKLPGEEVVFVFRDQNPINSGEDNNLTEAPNYMKWWYYVLGY